MRSVTAFTLQSPAPTPEVLAQEAAALNAALEQEKLQAYLASIGSNAMANIEIDVQLVRDGRDAREAEHHTFFHKGAGAHNDASSLAQAMKWVRLLQRVHPNIFTFSRTVITEVDASGKAIQGASTSVALDERGLFAIPAGVRMARRDNVVRFEKTSSVGGRSGRLDLRGVLTGPELATYTADGSLPDRFKAAGSTDEAPGTFEAAFLAAATGGPWKLHLPDIKKNKVLTPRPVTAVRFAGVKGTQPTRSRTSGQRYLIRGTQILVNQLGDSAQFILDSAPDTGLTAGQKTQLGDLRGQASQLITKLDVGYRARVVLPDSLTTEAVAA